MRKRESVGPNQWVSPRKSEKNDIESILLESEKYKIIQGGKEQNNSLEAHSAVEKHIEEVLLNHPLDHKKLSNANSFYFFTVEIQFDLLGR